MDVVGVTEWGSGPEAGSILFLTSVVIRVSSQVAIVSISVIGLSDALWSTMGWGSKTFGLPSSGARERLTARCLPVVIVMQTAQQWMRDDLPACLRPILLLWLARNALLYPLVWPGIVEVRLVLLHHSM